MIRVAVLTVSDSVVRGTREDLSGPELSRRLQDFGWDPAVYDVVPDERTLICERLVALSDSGSVALILTTGGTGMAARDVTPEATRDAIEREAPGIAELMRSEGLKHTRRAMLSRGVAGTRGRTLIINLPGSTNGALESLNAVADLIPHIVDLLEGRTEHKASE